MTDVLSLATVQQEIVVQPNGEVLIELREEQSVVEISNYGAVFNYTGEDLSQAGYEFTQVSPVSVWVINHDLGRFPKAVTILSPGGVEVSAGVQHTSINQVIVSFGAPYAGIARII